jgi:hypothetical protein
MNPLPQELFILTILKIHMPILEMFFLFVTIWTFSIGILHHSQILKYQEQFSVYK